MLCPYFLIFELICGLIAQKEGQPCHCVFATDSSKMLLLAVLHFT